MRTKWVCCSLSEGILAAQISSFDVDVKQQKTLIDFLERKFGLSGTKARYGTEAHGASFDGLS
jgi:hypothetical protein